ncbi:MAG: hypothetical protein U0470_08825 [Anaerolineae bacterium]
MVRAPQEELPVLPAATDPALAEPLASVFGGGATPTRSAAATLAQAMAERGLVEASRAAARGTPKCRRGAGGHELGAGPSAMLAGLSRTPSSGPAPGRCARRAWAILRSAPTRPSPRPPSDPTRDHGGVSSNVTHVVAGDEPRQRP